MTSQRLNKNHMFTPTILQPHYEVIHTDIQKEILAHSWKMKQLICTGPHSWNTTRNNQNERSYLHVLQISTNEFSLSFLTSLNRKHITFTWILAQPSMTNDSTQHAWCLTGERYLVLQLPVFVQSEVQLAIKSISINVSSIHLVFNMQSNTDTLISWYLLVLLKKSTLFTTFTQTFTKTVTKLSLVRYHFKGY